MRLVNHDIAEHLRVVCGCIAAEGEQIIFLVSRPLLRGSGLSGNFIAHNLRGISGSVGDNAAQRLAQEERGLLRTGLSHQLRAVIPNDRALGIQDLLHHMRAVVGSAVDHRGKGRRKLYHIAAEALAEAIGRELDRAEAPTVHALRRIQHVNLRRGIRLTRKIDAAAHAEAVEILGLLKVLTPEFLRDANQGYVTGLFECSGHVDNAVAGSLVAVNEGSLHIDFSGAVIGLVPVDHAVFERTGNRKYFRRGAGLNDAAHAEIIPEFLRCLLARHLLQRVYAVVFLQIAGVIQIEGVVGRKRQNFAVVRIHHDDADVFRTGRLHILLDVALHTLLHLDVYGAHDGISVLRFPGHTFGVTARVHIAIAQSVRAGELTVIILLDSGHADSPVVVTPVKAQHIAGKFAVGITALVIVVQSIGSDQTLVACFLFLRKPFVARIFFLFFRLVVPEPVDVLLKIQIAKPVFRRERRADL